MKIEKIYKKLRYTLSNENLSVGDEVYHIAKGRIDLKNNEFILKELDFRDFMSGFLNEPHIIIDLKYSSNKAYEVQTTCGFSPKESYFKIIKIEKQVIQKTDLLQRNEWFELKSYDRKLKLKRILN